MQLKERIQQKYLAFERNAYAEGVKMGMTGDTVADIRAGVYKNTFAYRWMRRYGKIVVETGLILVIFYLLVQGILYLHGLI